MNERMNEQTTDVCFAGYEEKEVQSDYALVIYFLGFAFYTATR